LQPAKAAVVVNPASGNGKSVKRWPEIAEALKAEGLSFVYKFTEKAGDATDLTRRYLQEGYELIISVGGDGTGNEVINGFFDHGKAVQKNSAVAFIPTGTGSDLVRTAGVPKINTEAVKHIIRSPVRPVDLGKVTYLDNQGAQITRYFINIAGLGLDGDTVNRVNRTSKALGGFISFLWGTVISLLFYRNQNMTITVDGELVCREPVTVVVIGNGRYFGGGMKIAPHVEMDDGLFDIVILHSLTKKDLLLNLPRVYRGTHLGHPCITSLRGRNITVSSTGNALLNLDGEQPGRDRVASPGYQSEKLDLTRPSQLGQIASFGLTG